MDSQPMSDELIDIVDNDWRSDTLPFEDIQLPLDKLPDPENNDAEGQTSLKEQEDKWLDLAIMTRHADEQLNTTS